MTNPAEQDLIYDWNTVAGGFKPGQPVEFDDETLRDGLQSPSVTDPPITDKLRMLHLMHRLGLQAANIGLPGAGPRARADVLALAREIANHRLAIFPNCAARTVEADIIPIVEISQQAGIAIEAATFLGSSPVRLYAENWDIHFLQHTVEKAVSFVVKHGLPAMFVTEDTIRSHPDTVALLYSTAVRAGATRVVVCDTVGHATPAGVRALVQFVRQVVHAINPAVKVDWHGHRDRGLALSNTLTAIEAGADRVHGTILGIGERVGNTPLDLILVNCKLLGWIDNDLTALQEYCALVSRACGVPVPANYPVFGRDAFRTGTGVHAAAIIKARKKGQDWLADLVYSGVPASWFGRRQEIEIGHMSGESNVIYWLTANGIEPTRPRIEAIFAAAKRMNRNMTDEEIHEVLRSLEH
ncbi:MAG: LeuA family protein [candidate division KSB1 bacterium]|nr:LeuA family protein [candidate division KSB1 bacterium]MDZ7274798.1 LeuA family protein [candidate division KSB1 bacterium]MDZ7285623.1 LeuA family protein [candidate division KSB1 bacterium]MDZ7298655.1 LeuA family protein [candidate division KSB1 bacterium]MDZ7307495.1 LeuA family protein [candidate division KSB1 bacterium]